MNGNLPLRPPPPPPSQRARDARSNYFAAGTYNNTAASATTPSPPPPPPPAPGSGLPQPFAGAATPASATATAQAPPPPPPPRHHASSSSLSLLLTQASLSAANAAATATAKATSTAAGAARTTTYTAASSTRAPPPPAPIPPSAGTVTTPASPPVTPPATAPPPPFSSVRNPPAAAAEAIHGPVRAAPARDAPPPTDRLIVGVDFGTTFSGVAAVYTPMPDDIEIIKTWPGGNGITSDKVPTELVYDFPEGTGAGGGDGTPSGTVAPTIRWGFQCKPEEARLRCIKLFLDRTQKLPFYVSPLETAAQLSRAGKTVIDAVADYLTQLRVHTMDALARRYGAAFLAATRVDFVLTCPAVWSDAAKDTTLRAAERAGLGARATLQMVSEPEAAAVYTLRTLQQHRLAVGDNVLVVDGGGGTVDLIAYRIRALPPHGLRVEESAVGTGGLCGSAFLNYRFAEHVRARLGDARFEAMQTKKAKTWQLGLRYFEEFVKRNFHEDAHQEINIPFPGLPDDEEAGLDSGFLVMTGAEVQAIFEPIVQEVCDLVQGQVDGLRAKGEVVSGIILVGGFGQSDYLYRRLQAQFGSGGGGGGGADADDAALLAGHGTGSSTQLPPPPYSERPTHAAAAMDVGSGGVGVGVGVGVGIGGAGGYASIRGGGAHRPIEIMQPAYAWTAVVRGAVLRGLEGSMVLARRARFHYGTSYATVYDEAVHAVSDRYWSPLWERWMVSDRMQWHIAKGDALSPLAPVAFHYTRNFRPGQSLVVTDDLLACAADVPPAAYVRGGGGDDTQPDGGPGLIHVCTLTTDLSAVPRSLFTRLTTTRGVEFDNLDFTLEMVVDSAGLGFELKVDGVRYGRVEAEFH